MNIMWDLERKSKKWTQSLKCEQLEEEDYWEHRDEQVRIEFQMCGGDMPVRHPSGDVR